MTNPPEIDGRNSTAEPAQSSRRVGLRIARLAGATIAACLVGLVLLTALLIFSERNGGVSTRPVDRDAEEKIRFLEEKGLVNRLDEEASTAYVDPLLWSGTTVDVKTNIIDVLSRHFKSKGHAGQVHIVDFRSGHKLADLSSWSGVTFY